MICINDGSTDATLDALLAQMSLNTNIKIIDFSRNFGKEAAMTAGIDLSTGDVVVPFDSDLQDPPEAILRLLQKWSEGFDVVIAKRLDRSVDGYIKRNTAALFYRIHNVIADIQIPENCGDFRLMSRKVINALKELPERQRFMKGLFSWVGFDTATIVYTRQARSAGESKFSGWKLWNFALEGITSFSTLPLRVWTYVGGMTAGFSVLYAIYLSVKTIVRGVDVPGYASLITAILFLGGVQLVGIGIIGEYIGRIYMESKHRPLYVVRKIYQESSGSA